MGCGVVGVLWWVSVVREWVAGFNTVFVWVGVDVTWWVEWVWAWLIFFFFVVGCGCGGSGCGWFLKFAVVVIVVYCNRYIILL